jgi:hypothetical protein
MKKLWIAIAVVAVVFVAGLGAASMVSAQAGNPPTVDGTVSPMGGMMGQRWGGTGMLGGGTEVLHDLTVSAWAVELNLSVDDLNARLAAGETLAEIAAEQGISPEDFTTLWVEVRFSVLDEAVAQGLISADQAQFMKDRIQARLDAGWVMGMGTGTGCTMQDGTRSPRMGGMGMSRGSQGGMMGGGNR